MFDANNLLNAIKKAAVEAVDASQPSDFCFGKVISVSPLKISIEQKMTLGSAQLILPKNMTDYTIPISIKLTTNDALSTHNHTVEGIDSRGDTIELTSRDVDLKHQHTIDCKNEIIIHNALQINDEVILLKQKGGQKYLVFDKVVKA